MTDRKFKRVNIIISEVENGYEVGMTWAFNCTSVSSADEDGGKDFVAKTEKEVLEIVAHEYRRIRFEEPDDEE